MGGRGSSSGVKSASSKSTAKSKTSKGGGSISAVNTKFTGKQISAMSRKQLEAVATAVVIKQNVKRGLSESEAARRASLLMDGNSSAQLRKFIKKYG